MISYRNSMPWMNLVQMPESLLEPECSCIACICRGFQLMETRREELSNRMGWGRVSRVSMQRKICMWISSISLGSDDISMYMINTNSSSHILSERVPWKQYYKPKDNVRVLPLSHGGMGKFYFRKGRLISLLYCDLLLTNWFNSSLVSSLPSSVNLLSTS